VAKAKTEAESSAELAKKYGEQAVAAFDPNRANAIDDLFSDDSDVIAGHDLLKEELFDELVGVPFAVTRITFRPGKVHPVTKRLQAYCSMEAVIAPLAILEKRKINLAVKPFRPEDMVVLNDGSTGLYRQCVQYLAGREFIVLPDGPEDGPKGFCRYDMAPHEWEDIKVGEYSHDADTGFINYSVNIKLRADRGIRLSTYENEYTSDGKTRYFA
jgi:hypothetical protein